MAYTCVANSEEEPLCVTVSIDVVLKHQVILIVTDFHSAKQIASFEARFEDKRLVVRAIGYVKRSRRQLRLLFHGVLAACGFQLHEFLALALNVVVFDEFLNVDQVSGNLAHRLSQVRIVDEHRSLTSKV